MKVLQLIGGLDPAHGGPPVVAINGCIAAQRAGIGTTLVYGAGRVRNPAVEAASARLEAEGVRTVALPYRTALGETAERWGVMDGLVRWLRANRARFDVVHCHGAWQAATLAIALGAGRRRDVRQPAVLTPHESLTDFDIALSRSAATRIAKRRLRPLFLNRFDMVVAASTLECRDSAAAGRGKSAVIPHPVFDERAGLPQPRQGPAVSGRLSIGFIGRLHAKKNVDVLIRALARLPPPADLVVAGDGPEAAPLRALAERCGVAARIAWLGFVQDRAKEDFFRRIDLLALPSAYECFGVAAAEAMVAGLPVLVSPRTGMAGLIAAHGGGLTVAPDPDAVAAALRALLDDPADLARHAAQAASAAASTLSFAAHGAALRQAYEAVCGDVKAA